MIRWSAMSVTPQVPGRHRRSVSARSALRATLDVVGRLGTLVALTALLVVAGAVGGLFDGMPATTDAGTAGTVTFDGDAR
jgi:hypothetical protein